MAPTHKLHKKTLSRINVMRKLKSKLDIISIETINFTFIRPMLEYGGVVWNSIEKDDLEKIQIQAARIAIGATKRISITCNLRNSNDFQTMEARTSLHYHSFQLTTIRGCNSLSEEVKSCDSINSFNHQL